MLCLLLIFTYGCSHSQVKTTSDAKTLTDQAIQLEKDRNAMVETRSVLEERKINLLNQAISRDSMYIDAYCVKLIAQNSLKKFDEALITAKQMAKIKPQDWFIDLNVGEAYERTGDTITAVLYYRKSFNILNKELDTMSVKNNMVDMEGKATALILLNQPRQGRSILRNLVNSATASFLKQHYEVDLRMSRDEFLYGPSVESIIGEKTLLHNSP